MKHRKIKALWFGIVYYLFILTLWNLKSLLFPFLSRPANSLKQLSAKLVRKRRAKRIVKEDGKRIYWVKYLVELRNPLNIPNPQLPAKDQLNTTTYFHKVLGTIKSGYCACIFFILHAKMTSEHLLTERALLLPAIPFFFNTFQILVLVSSSDQILLWLKYLWFIYFSQ